jgi:hypothetical protein
VSAADDRVYQRPALDQPGLRAFVEDNLEMRRGVWPPRQWDAAHLTLAALYFDPPVRAAMESLYGDADGRAGRTVPAPEDRLGLLARAWQVRSRVHRQLLEYYASGQRARLAALAARAGGGAQTAAAGEPVSTDAGLSLQRLAAAVGVTAQALAGVTVDLSEWENLPPWADAGALQREALRQRVDVLRVVLAADGSQPVLFDEAQGRWRASTSTDDGAEAVLLQLQETVVAALQQALTAYDAAGERYRLEESAMLAIQREVAEHIAGVLAGEQPGLAFADAQSRFYGQWRRWLDAKVALRAAWQDLEEVVQPAPGSRAFLFVMPAVGGAAIH